MTLPQRQIRAQYNQDTIRVYQAYNHDIADTALAKGTFVSPPFKMERMTWIKPSFLWMMYRAGWGFKDSGQARILALDVALEGFTWILEQGKISTFVPQLHKDHETWRQTKTPVRIQWDPERNLKLEKLDYRSLQVGLTGIAVKKYVNEWIQHIEDVTPLAHAIHDKVKVNDLEAAQALLPVERPFPVADHIAARLLIDP